MRCTKNGITVAHVDTPHWVRKGDQFRCPECGNKIVTSLGEAYDSNVAPVVVIEDALSDAEVDVIQAPIDWMAEL